MNDSREALEMRRDEILAQLEDTRHDLPGALDRDPEEQAIEIQQFDVPAMMIENLRRELAEIEDKLLSLND